MTKLLDKAFSEAAKLSPEEQDAIASVILAELESERRWHSAFAESQDALASLAGEAVSEDERGDTEELDPAKL